MQRGRTRGETARQAREMGHGLLPLMTAREGIGHIHFHEAPPRENPSLLTRPESELSTPNSFAETFADEYSSTWLQAMEKEFERLASAGTFGDMQQPEGLNVISAKWAFAWKTNEHGYVVRVKASQVDEGFKRREGIDYFRDFCSNVCGVLFSLVDAIACELGLDRSMSF